MHAPARALMRALYAEFDDPDGNFAEQFQTTGFDARTFELYLFALFNEGKWKIGRRHKQPDFILERDDLVICVEATTTNVPGGGTKPYLIAPEDDAPDRQLEYFQNEVPIRFGSPLFSKLQKRYWELPHIKGRPLVFAIEAFHGPGSLTHSSSSLTYYLFGLSQRWYHDETGQLII